MLFSTVCPNHRRKPGNWSTPWAAREYDRREKEIKCLKVLKKIDGLTKIFPKIFRISRDDC